MAKLFKNLLFWSIVSFGLGMFVAGWGWDKETSTIEKRTHGSVFLIITGCVMIVGGGIGMYHFGSWNEKS